jgi:general secretion pathway protein M
MIFPLSARIHDFLDGLAPRERNLLTAGVMILLPLGLYLYLWQPINSERTRLISRVTHLRGELVQLRADSKEVERLRAQHPIHNAQTLEASIRLAATRFGMDDKSATLTPQGQDRVQVNLSSVAFDTWLRWVGELSLQGVSLVACKVEALPANGQVRIQATLTRGSD